MEQVWYTTNLNNIPAEPHYGVGDFNYALFTVTEIGYTEPVQWTE